MVTDGGENTLEPDDRAVRVEPLIFELLAQGLSVEFKVTGSSMAPLIRSHDVLSVAPVITERLRCGDVIAWKRGRDSLVVHRIISVRKRSFVTRGDAVNSPDGPIDTNQVVGKAIAVIRNGQSRTFGLGPERVFVAWLSRLGWLLPCLRVGSKIRRSIGRKPSRDEGSVTREEGRR